MSDTIKNILHRASFMAEVADLDAWLIVRAITAESTATLSVSGIIRERTGNITQLERSVPLTGNRTVDTLATRLAGGLPLSLSFTLSSANHPINSAVVEAYVASNDQADAIRYRTLGKWSIGSGQSKSWPDSPDYEAEVSPGHMRTLIGADPAVAAEAADIVPANAIWGLTSYSIELVTDANAANRVVGLQLRNGSSVFGLWPSPDAQVASLTERYSWGPGAATVANVGTAHGIAIPNGSSLVAGETFGTSSVNLQAGDNFGAPIFKVAEWLFF